MMDVMDTCYRLVGDLLHSLSGHCKPVMKAVDDESTKQQQGMQQDELAARALTAVFGMDSNWRIKKEKARSVVQKLGLIGKDEGFGFEEGEELRAELLQRAFMVFDKDGDGFIDSLEVKRVMECLGLVGGWEMGEFERMVKVADLSFNGKVDFGVDDECKMSICFPLLTDELDRCFCSFPIDQPEAVFVLGSP